ncbi:MAG: HesA/MoeB/ThiF family protein [Eubacteriales bacterium]
MPETRYARQEYLHATDGTFNDILNRSSVLICGAGGLGCPAAIYLTAAGLSKLGIIDSDTVNDSNLNRQILYNPSDTGKKKAPLAKERLHILNPDVKINSYCESITEELLNELLPGYDLVMDCTDNYPTRLIIASAAHRLYKPAVTAGVREFEGFVLNTRNSACFGCLYEKEPKNNSRPQVLGAAAGALGAMAAAQALLFLTGSCSENRNLMLLDLAELECSSVKFEKNPNCPVCASEL